VLLFQACDGYHCEEWKKRYIDQAGQFIITKLAVESDYHCFVMIGADGRKILFDNTFFVFMPTIGDSIYKEKGSDIYVLVKGDSVYLQTLDCTTELPKIAKSYRVGDSVNFILNKDF
jgi:hypothetical protein